MCIFIIIKILKESQQPQVMHSFLPCYNTRIYLFLYLSKIEAVSGHLQHQKKTADYIQAEEMLLKTETLKKQPTKNASMFIAPDGQRWVGRSKQPIHGRFPSVKVAAIPCIAQDTKLEADVTDIWSPCLQVACNTIGTYLHAGQVQTQLQRLILSSLTD